MVAPKKNAGRLAVGGHTTGVGRPAGYGRRSRQFGPEGGPGQGGVRPAGCGRVGLGCWPVGRGLALVGHHPAAGGRTAGEGCPADQVAILN